MKRTRKIRYLAVFCIITLSFVSYLSNVAAGQTAQAVIAAADEFNGRAVAQIRDENYQEAVGLLKKAVAIDPAFAEAYLNLGTAFLLSGRPEDALEPIKKGISLAPRSHQGFNQLGVVYDKLGDANASIAAFRKAVELKDDYARGHFNLGSAYLWANRLKPAAASLRRAVELDPSNSDARLYLAAVLARQNRFRDAVAQAKSVTDRDPDHEAANLLLCNLYLLADDRPAALTMYQNFKAQNESLAEQMFRSIFNGKVVFVNKELNP